MIVFPNAKINLGLAVTAKRPDGYHELSSCFYPTGWSDVLEILPAHQFAFRSTGIDIPGDPAANLCIKAWQRLAGVYGIPPVSMHLHKVIPIGAGMGGGSADGAFALKALNEMFDLGLSVTQLEAYALELGSDCPFFVQNQPVMVGGRGEVFTPLDLSLTGQYIVLVYPGIHISTKEAYAGIIPRQPAKPVRQVLGQDRSTWRSELHNDFEDSLFGSYPKLASLKSWLYEQGAWYAAMTGSGSTVFGLFEREPVLALPANVQSWRGWMR